MKICSLKFKVHLNSTQILNILNFEAYIKIIIIKVSAPTTNKNYIKKIKARSLSKLELLHLRIINYIQQLSLRADEEFVVSDGGR